MPSRVLSPNAWAQYAANAGVTGANLVTAIAVLMAESGGNANAVNVNSDGSQDQGGWQINTVHSGEFPGMHFAAVDGKSCKDPSVSVMFDPQTNANAMAALSRRGADFSAWVTYTQGIYNNYMNAAKLAASGASTATYTDVKLGPVDIPTSAGDVANDVGSAAIGAVPGLQSLIDDITNPKVWMRIGVGAVGLALLLWGFFKFANKNGAVTHTAEMAAIA